MPFGNIVPRTPIPDIINRLPSSPVLPPGLEVVKTGFDSVLDMLKKIGVNIGFRSASNFPLAMNIMGLPPIYHSSTDDISIMNQIETNFPILDIKPLNVKAGDKEGSQNVNIMEIARNYKYAVQVDNSINVSHTNNYAQSQLTNDLKQVLEYNTVRDLSQLSKVYTGGGASELVGGLSHAAAAGIGDSLKDLVKPFEAMVGGANNIKAGAGNALSNIGHSILDTLSQGARVDFPNIWQDSQTGMSHSFTIELRTFATSPTDEEYIKDIITPLEVLLHLALPNAEGAMAYIEPPYVKATIANVFEIRLGGITNMSWSIPLSTLNLTGVPRHIQINITITDLYNVMVNDANGSTAEETPTLQKFINHLKEPAKHPVANEHIWSREFYRGAGDVGVSAAASVALESGQQKKYNTPGSDVSIRDTEISLNKIIPKNITNITLNYSNGQVIVYHDGKMLTSINNIKEIQGVNLATLPVTIDLTQNNISLILD